MDDWQLSDEERELEGALRRECDAEQQEFSDSLHSRIMDAVRREGVDASGQRTARPAPHAAQSTSSRKSTALFGYLLAAGASIAILVTGIASIVDLGDAPDVVEAPRQQSHDGADELAMDDDTDVLDSVLLVAEEMLLSIPSDQASLDPMGNDDMQEQGTDDKIVKVDSSTAEQWDDIAHDVEILANVLFDPISTGEIETP